MQPSDPLLETIVSPEGLAKLSTGRKASFDPERSNKSFGFRAAAEPLEVDLSPSFALDPLDGAKLCQGERFRHFSIDDKYLLYKGRVCVQSTGDFCAQIFKESHDSPSVSHPEIHKTYALVKRQFYWPSLFKDLQAFVLKCHKFQVNKHERLKVGGLLHPLDIPKGKWESISMNFITSLPRTNRNHD